MARRRIDLDGAPAVVTGAGTRVVAVDIDRIMVAVGGEAKPAWAAHRVLPLAAHQFVAGKAL